MAAAWRRFFGHTTVVILEILAVVALLVLLCVGVLVWRINTGPLDVSFAKEYVEDSLRDPVTGYSITLDSVQTAWPDLAGPLLLQLKNVSLLKDNRTVLNVGAIDLSLSKSKLLRGQIGPQGIVLSHPSLRLLRTRDNRIVLSLKDEMPDPAAAEAEDTGDNSALMQMLRSLARPAGTVDKRSPLDRLETLEIKHARTVVEDHAREITWYLPDLDLMFVRDNKGLVLTANMALPAPDDASSHIRADIAYSRARDNIGINLTLQNVDPDVIGGRFEELDFLSPHDLTVSGELEAVLGGDLAVQDVAVDVSTGPGALDLPDLYDKPFAFDGMDVRARYDRAAGVLDIDHATLRAHDATLTLKAHGPIGPQGGSLAVTAAIPALPQDRLTLFWPDSARQDSAAEWLMHKMSGGRFENIGATLDLKATRVPDENGGEKWAVAADNIKADIALADMDVDYRAPLQPLTAAQATGHYENDMLAITVTAGKLGKLAADKATVTLTDLIHGKPGGVKIAAAVSGALPDVLAYIASEPIGMDADRLGFDAKTAQGHAKLDVDISFPALRDLPADKVKVAVKGTLTDTMVPGVVKDMALTGGPLALSVGDGMVRLSGKGQLDGRAIDLAWEQFLESAGKPYMGRVKAQLVADKALRDKLGIGLDDWIAGAAPVDVVYTEYAGGKADVDVTADLTPAIITVRPFKYEKPVGVNASARAFVTLQNNIPQQVSNLAVHTPDLNFEGARLTFRNEGGEGVLRQGSFPRVTLGENDLKLDMDIQPDGTLKLTAGGAFFDARPFLGKDKDKAAQGAAAEPYTGPAVIAAVDVARMRAHTGRVVDKAKIYMEMAANGQVNRIDMDCTAGRGPVALRLRPDAQGKMTLRLEAGDAGAALAAFGIYDNIAGGKLVIQGQAASVKTPRTLHGTVQLTDFKAVNAPVLARLVSAISPTGLAELLSSDGIYFARLESKFDWYMRQPGDLYVINGGRTSGSSLGLTFEGQIDKAAGQVDVNGNIVPISMVNDMISAIPIIGTILSGGSEGGVFAATYTIKGPQDDPVVSVNPLSVLAPGIIRRILFEGD